MQRRLLLASVLSAVAMMGYFYMNTRNAPPLPPLSENPAVVEQLAEPEASAAEPGAGSPEQPAEQASPPPAEVAEAPAGDVAAEAEQEIVVESDTYRVTFSNRGAVVKSWILKQYENSIGEQLDLVHIAGTKQYGYPFQLQLPGGEAIKAVNEALFAVDEGGSPRTAPATITFNYAAGGWSARKTFRFEPQGYVLHLETELRQAGEPRSHLVAWPGGFGDLTQVTDAAHSQTFYFDPAADKPVRNTAEDAAEQRISNTGPHPYAGIDDLFFTAVFSPAEGQPLTLESWAAKLIPESVVPPEGADQAALEELKETFAAAAVGGSAENSFELYVGPKSIPILAAVSPRHRQIVDFGWLSFLALPLFYMLLWTHEHMVANYGWAIVLVTVAINFVLFPLKWKSTKSMKRMQALQPLIKQINEKYKGLSMRDPKKAQQNEEMMALYKKYGVNPMGGCLPMVLQMPFFIAFYWVLTSAIEMRHASWLWVDDLSRPETLAIRVLPLAMIITQFWQQHMTPQPTIDPAQARLMKFMPLMFGFFFYGFQSGLVLYWLTMNLVGVGQQALLNRLPSEPLEIEQPRRRKKKK
ncbi:MAG: membrane protein insertase YidC [Bryobacterales bacterium]